MPLWRTLPRQWAGGHCRAPRACDVTISSTSCLVASRAGARASPRGSARCGSSSGACLARPPGPAATWECRAATTASATCRAESTSAQASRRVGGKAGSRAEGSARLQKGLWAPWWPAHPPLRCCRAAAPPPRRTPQLPGARSARRLGKPPVGVRGSHKVRSAQVQCGGSALQASCAQSRRTLHASAASSRSLGDLACWTADSAASISHNRVVSPLRATSARRGWQPGGR